MFTKFVIFLAIGCSITLATSTQGNRQHGLIRRQPRSIFGTLGSWVNTATNAATYPYRKAFNILLQTGQGFADYGAEKVQQVMEKYHEIKNAYQKNIDDIKNDIIKRAIGELQKVINILAHQNDTKTCTGIKQTNQELVLSGKEALDKLEQDLQEAVDAELKNLEDELANWQIEADDVVKGTKERAKRSSSPDDV